MPLERPFELGAGRVAAPLAGLGGEEDLVAVVGQPRLQAVLRRAVGRRGVDVVDAPRVDRGERGVGAVLAHPAERGGAEDQPGRLVAGPAERCGRDHARPYSAIGASGRGGGGGAGDVDLAHGRLHRPGGGRRRSGRRPARAARARSVVHTSVAFGQRGWNRQPGGGSTGDGGSPTTSTPRSVGVAGRARGSTPAARSCTGAPAPGRGRRSGRPRTACRGTSPRPGR